MKKTGKKKHIGIYIHHQNMEHWLRIKELLPYFSCRLTLMSSLDIQSELEKEKAQGKEIEFIRLPCSKRASPSLLRQCKEHRSRMNMISVFIRRERPDLFYIDESVEIASFINLLGVPYVYARMKSDIQNDFGRQMAYGLSLFNIAVYDYGQEEDWYKKTPFYDKTKYPLKEKSEVNKKLFCMYLEEEICLKKEEALKPLLFKTFQ